jgi:hypothetical protein
MARAAELDTEIRYHRDDGTPIATTLAEVAATQVMLDSPVRPIRSRAADRHYCGLFWSATMGSHLPYESRLKHDRLLLADFDPPVSANRL